MKAMVALLCGTVLAAGGAHAQDAENCFKYEETTLGGQKAAGTIQITPITDAKEWATQPVLFVHDEYQGRGSCKTRDMNCWVRAHDVLWVKDKNKDGLTLKFGRKRGDSSSIMEYGLDMTPEPGLGRYLSGTTVAATGVPARDVFLLPLGERSCPATWYPAPPPQGHSCRFFLVQVYNVSNDLEDQVNLKKRPNQESNWVPCGASLIEAGWIGSAHEPPK